MEKEHPEWQDETLAVSAAPPSATPVPGEETILVAPPATGAVAPTPTLAAPPAWGGAGYPPPPPAAGYPPSGPAPASDGAGEPPLPPVETGGMKNAVLVIVGIVVLAGAILGAYAVWKKYFSNAAAFKTPARYTPRDAYGFFSFDDPGRMLGICRDLAAKNPGAKQLVDRLSMESEKTLGFDALSAEGWDRAGFASAQPLFVSFLTNPKQSASPEFLASLGISNEEKALESFRRLLALGRISLEKEAGGDFPLYRGQGLGLEKGALALAFKDSRAFLLFSLATGPATGRLREILQTLPAQTLQEDPEFQHASAQCSPHGLFSAYVDFRNIFKTAFPAGVPAAAQALRSLAMSSGEDRMASFCSLEPNAPILQYLKPGGSCNEILARMPRPFMAGTMSLDNPVGLLRYVAEGIGPKAGLDEGVRKVKETLGISLDDLEALTRGASMGVAFYFPELSMTAGPPEPDVVAVAELKDPAKARELLKSVAATRGLAERTLGEAVLYSAPGGKPGVVALSGKYLLGGTAVTQIEEACKSTAVRWSPLAPADALLSLEAYPWEIVKAIPPQIRPMIEKSFEGIMGEESMMHYLLTRRENGLLLEARTESLSPAWMLAAGGGAAYALPSLLESKKAAQDASAVSMLRNIASAQSAYSAKTENEGKYGTFADLSGQQFLDSRFAQPEPVIDGFHYAMTAEGNAFTVTAEGVGEQAGRVYYINQEMVVCTDPECTSPYESASPNRVMSGEGKPDTAVQMLRNIASAEIAYSSRKDNGGQYGTFADLARQKCLDGRFSRPEPVIDGFQYTLTADDGVFTCAASGLDANAGKLYFINNALVVCTDPACTKPVTE